MGKGQVRVLTLELNVEGSKTLYRLKQGWTLQFRLGPSLLGRTVHIWTNCPLKSEGYDRLSYQVLKWESDASNKSDDTAIFANIHLGTSGSFHYHISDEK
jgi:glycogen debranching enzyme